MSMKPKIIISNQDAERLEILLNSLSSVAFPAKAGLTEDLNRAVRMHPRQIPPTVVTMNSTVRFKLQPTGNERCLKLIYPGVRYNHEETVSILAQMGSMLIGLSEGDEMPLPLPCEENFRLVIKEVVDQPERSGNYDL
ncbi:MAG: nucleoside diphosphate kinase regulator [Proteobacteria bacterium]|nr:nucleoside diphosphate kinase regulator [Pseudomonadota bacterium]